MLKLKMHRDGIMQCQYSRDGTCVASCSQDADVKVKRRKEDAHYTFLVICMHVHVQSNVISIL